MMYSRSEQCFMPADWGDHCRFIIHFAMSNDELQPPKRLSIKYLTHPYLPTNCHRLQIHNIIDWFVVCDAKTEGAQSKQSSRNYDTIWLPTILQSPSFISVDWLFILFIFLGTCGNSQRWSTLYRRGSVESGRLFKWFEKRNVLRKSSILLIII